MTEPTQAGAEFSSPNKPSVAEKQARLDELLRRINGLSGGAAAEEPNDAAAQPTDETAIDRPHGNTFLPLEPASFQQARLTSTEVEGLILKLLLSRGDATGRQVTDHVKLPFALLDALLREMKTEQLVVYKGAAAMNDYLYQLTDFGRERARRLSEHCTYFGAAPISINDYIDSVKAQSLTTQHPTEVDLQRAFDGLLINERMLQRLGPAINSGRGLFLYGGAGNGKTSIAERITRAFGQEIWIPRAIGIDGEILRLFDPMVHEELPLEASAGRYDHVKIDKRWVRIRRPTIVVGGELTMDNLEVTLNTSTGISESPMQLKSNCGTLVIDDFGRQRMTTSELLNRWIVPLEKRIDYLNLANGKKIQVPFDQLIIFATNLEPKDLVDDAFLRRIPYKVEVCDPTVEEFRELFKILSPKMELEYHAEAVEYLIEKHFVSIDRRMRCCHPRDLLLQVRNYCFYHQRPMEITPDLFDFAVENYFGVV